MDWNFKSIGVNAVWNSNCMGGGSSLNFQRGKMAKASLEIIDLTTFPV